jgi:hypothetical protein
VKAVPDVKVGQDVAICSEWPLPFAFLEPQPAVPQPSGKLLATSRFRTSRDQRGIPLLGHVKVVALETTSRYADPLGEALQLVVRGIADQV